MITLRHPLIQLASFCLAFPATSLSGAEYAGFTYTSSGGAITITDYDGPGGAVVIPDTIAGLPVRTLDSFSFDFNDTITSITVPSSVTSIAASAFLYCSSLESITIPGTVTSIGGSAFAYCSSLKSISLPESMTSIGDGAFAYCYSLESITIPATLTSIGSSVLAHCRKLSNIQVAPGNPSYRTHGGALFDSGLTRLIQYPVARPGGYTIPAGVTTIGYAAFASCKGLISMTFPESITTIEIDAFLSCNNLTSVTFLGNAPVMERGNFPPFGLNEGFTIYYYSTRSGFTSPMLDFYPAIAIGSQPRNFNPLDFPVGSSGLLDRNGPLNLPNLVTYAMGINYASAAPEDLPAPAGYDHAEQTATFRYQRAKTTVGVSLEPMISSNLIDWESPVITKATVVQDRGDSEIIEIETPSPPGEPLFFRAEAQENSPP